MAHCSISDYAVENEFEMGVDSEGGLHLHFPKGRVCLHISAQQAVILASRILQVYVLEDSAALFEEGNAKSSFIHHERH